ncbi:MAG: CinA family protein [Pseudohongiellaceae bacterium]
MINPDEFENSIECNVRVLAELLTSRQYMLATAESCTGGWIAQELTALAGSSSWFDSGFVTYSNEAKQSLLDVPADFFEEAGPGAVSEETVRAMTAGAIANSRANVAVAVSGVAGPAGGSEEKPVGTVWIAWQVGLRTVSRRYSFAGDRRSVRAATVLEALERLIVMLEE